MKLDRLETHDRLQHFIKGEFDISKTCQSIIDSSPFGDVPYFYIFAHKREMGSDERYAYWMQSGCLGGLSDIPSARIIWQPRLTKPQAQENSMLFRVSPGSDIIKIIWMIPQKELWGQYDKGKMLEDSIIYESIYKFKNCRKFLESKEDGDLIDQEIQNIYQEIARKKVMQVK